MIQRAAIQVSGLVQGVGFRPFVYALATALDLRGFVQNRGAHVEIDVEGEPGDLDLFIHRVEGELPRGAVIDRVDSIRLAPAYHHRFAIIESAPARDVSIRIPPDAATCDDCLRELFDPANRRFRHPFITCTACGPRYSVVTRLPYDRANTTMAAFDMCAQCQEEYANPRDRRFHAQSTACHECGPILIARDPSRVMARLDAAMALAVDVLARGGVVATKGIGGFHLACDATNEAAVAELRRRKGREAKPLAVMLPRVDRGVLRSLSYQEADALASPERPIVLVDQRLLRLPAPWRIADNVAPASSSLGIFLPYTPVHHLLLHDLNRPLVMTSGNRCREPMAFRDDEAIEHLAGFVDLFLMHDRPIARRCDDSVVRSLAGRIAPIRRGRGHSPSPIHLAEANAAELLAVGGHLKNACCFVSGANAYLSPHIGDLETADAYQSFIDTVQRLERLLDLNPEFIAHDRHPDYLSTRFAVEHRAATRIAVQHHHAHVLSCAAEHRLTEPVIGVAFDGTGLGDDGAVWGGEFLVVDGTQCLRMAHLKYVPLPGGDAAAREPWRMAVAHLTAAFGPGLGPLGDSIGARLSATALKVVSQMTLAGVCSPPTSSMGRLFDAVAAASGLRDVAAFEGQGAMELEALACGQAARPYRFELDTSGRTWTIDAAPVIRALAADVAASRPIHDIAADFHAGVSGMIVDVTARIARQTGIRRVALTGGVFQNARLSSLAAHGLAQGNLDVLLHRRVPCNDGGLALGQALQAIRVVRAGQVAEDRRVCV